MVELIEKKTADYYFFDDRLSSTKFITFCAIERDLQGSWNQSEENVVSSFVLKQEHS